MRLFLTIMVCTICACAAVTMSVDSAHQLTGRQAPGGELRRRSGRKSKTSRRRRRRRSAPEKDNSMKAIVDELKSLRAIVKEQGEKLSLQGREIEMLSSKVDPFAKAFEWDAKGETRGDFGHRYEKTLILKDWNLMLTSPANAKGRSNLILGDGHSYRGASRSLFTGSGHIGQGRGMAFIGGRNNQITITDDKFASGAGMAPNGAAIVGGSDNGIIGDARSSVIVGSKGSRIKDGALQSTIVGGAYNHILRKSNPDQDSGKPKLPAYYYGHNTIAGGLGERIVAGNASTLVGTNPESNNNNNDD